MGRHKPKKGGKVKAEQAPPSGESSQQHDPGTGGHTPETELAMIIHHAAKDNLPELLTDFIEVQKAQGKFDVNEVDSKKITALHFAVSTQQVSLVSILVENGANVNARDELGFTALFWATGRYRCLDIATYLLEAGKASVHIQTNTGASPLHGAALLGNLDSIKLLLKHGADPRCSDEEGTTPLDLAQDDHTKTLLYKTLKKQDEKADKATSSCAWCGGSPEDSKTLKRCARCHVTMYCGRDCQAKDWKEGDHKNNCHGFVVAKPKSALGGFSSMLNFQKMKCYTKDGDTTNTNLSDFHKKKQFVVKVQVPLGGSVVTSTDEMMVYNEDRSVSGFIGAEQNGYRSTRHYIQSQGVMGVKAYFWAEVNDAEDGSFKVFHGRAVPPQSW